MSSCVSRFLPTGPSARCALSTVVILAALPASSQVRQVNQNLSRAPRLEATLNIPEGILFNAVHSFRTTELAHASLPGNSSTLREVTNPLTIRESLRAGTIIRRFDVNATLTSTDAVSQFAIAQPSPSTNRDAASSFESLRPASHRARGGAWRAANWILQETLGDDGIRQIKQGCDMAKRYGPGRLLASSGRAAGA